MAFLASITVGQIVCAGLAVALVYDLHGRWRTRKPLSGRTDP